MPPLTKKTLSLTWQAPEYRHYEKNLGWYVTAIALGILVIGFFVIVQSDYFAAITLAVILAFVIFFAKQTPQAVDIELSGKGIRYGNVFIPYKQIKYFWVVHNENHKTVNFHTNTYVNNLVIFELEGQNPDEVRDFLIQHLPEHEETRETPIQRISHKLRF
ncbi:MAG: hypothetical protein M1383_04020 [Patescibacteria group bacterium]|nr:hypothetical protein [Patescibacteria group bacterium]